MVTTSRLSYRRGHFIKLFINDKNCIGNYKKNLPIKKSNKTKGETKDKILKNKEVDFIYFFII